jgi:hypothetical protein
MEVEFAFLADAAEAAPNQKLYVLGGGIEKIFAPAFPAIHPSLALVLKLKLLPDECDRVHRLVIELWGPNDQQLTPAISGDVTAQRDADDPARPRSVPLVLNILSLQLPQPGEYTFHIVLNGQRLKSVPLVVHEITTLELDH